MLERFLHQQATIINKRLFSSKKKNYFFGIIVTLLVKLLKTEEKVRTGHVAKKLTLGSCGAQRNEGGAVTAASGRDRRRFHK